MSCVHYTGGPVQIISQVVRVSLFSLTCVQGDAGAEGGTALPIGASYLVLDIQRRLERIGCVHERGLVAISGVLVNFAIAREHSFFNYPVVQRMVVRPGSRLLLLAPGATFDVRE
jgi:hypothetical protein